MSKRTNLDIKDEACLHYVHILQHPTSRPTTKSRQTTMVNAPKKNVLPLPAGKYGKSTKRSTQRRHQVNEGTSSLEAERVRALGVLRSLRSKKKLAAVKRREMHFLRNEDKEKWIEDYIERETAGARKRVDDAEAVVQQEQDDTRKAENVGLTNREPEKTFQEMMVAIGDSLSDHVSSDDGDDGEEEDEETEQGQLSEDDEPGWVMGTITKTVQQCLERFRQKQMTLDELTQPGWEDAADYFHESDKKYGTSALQVPAVIQQQTDINAPTPVPTTIGDLLDCLDIVPGISKLLQGTSRTGRSHIRLCSGKLQLNAGISDVGPTAKPDALANQTAKRAELVSFYNGISRPQIITI
jgi:hypothetical protein